MKFLGHTISSEGISVDPTKVQEVIVTPQVSVHLNTDHCTPFKLKRKMWEINSKRRGQIKVKVYKRN